MRRRAAGGRRPDGSRVRWYGTVTALLVALATIGAVHPAPASAHDERPPQMPDGSGHVPAYRSDGPRLLVCTGDRAELERRTDGFSNGLKEYNLALFDECQRDGYHHLQAAVDAVHQPGMRILVLPGLYREEPSQRPSSPECANLPARTAAMGYQVLSWEQQLHCPNNQNLVAVFNKTDLQVEGTGAQPTDVVFDAAFTKLNAIRVDRSNGFYLKNLTAQHTTFNAIYIMETDGFVIDRAVGRWTDEYGFLTFADDHGLYQDCEAYGNGDSGIYPGAAHDINAGRGRRVDRYAIEVKGCYSHDNTLGYSGTAGDSVWAHDNRFLHNSAGVSTDSAFPHHPGLPQNHAKFERNEIGDNNVDYYRYVRDGTCAKPSAQRGYDEGVVCPTVGVPTGTGVLNPGGNENIWRDNWVYANRYAGFLLAWVPGFVREDTRWSAQFDTSHHNQYVGNRMGVTPAGQARANGIDFWWDGQGRGNCWQADRSGPAEPATLPTCGADGEPAGAGTARLVAEPGKVLKLYVCTDYNLERAHLAGGCEWFGARGLARVEVRAATGEAMLLGALAVLLWWRRRTGPAPAAALGAGIAVAGVVVGVLGTVYEGTRLTAVGLALLACWWLLTGGQLRQRGRPVLGWLTVALGVVAALGAVDTGLWMLPWTPVPPSLVRIALELVWVPWVVVALLSRRPGPAGQARLDERGYESSGSVSTLTR